MRPIPLHVAREIDIKMTPNDKGKVVMTFIKISDEADEIRVTLDIKCKGSKRFRC